MIFCLFKRGVEQTPRFIFLKNIDILVFCIIEIGIAVATFDNILYLKIFFLTY